jgi:hypothetical protein
MAKVPLRPALLLVVALVVPASASAACVTDADCDNGDTCSVPDTCVSGSCVLGGGGDVAPADLVCDAELYTDLGFVLRKLSIRKRTSPIADNSSAKGVGFLVVSDGSPMAAFTDPDGITIRVQDGLWDSPTSPSDGVDASYAWPADSCEQAENRIICTSPTRISFARFKRSRIAPNEWAVTFKMKRLGDLQGPFFRPVRVVFTYRGDRHRSVELNLCELVGAGLRCRAV